ncbi:SPOR domain-containing protein [Ancylobacter sp.]|uniref:SPOR domain-containing protein n=1 Tax=Ancylobacter sp. TaxID=1872567 RepID=UPI003D130EE1
MGNENMRDRPENPAEDPLAELARLMAMEDDFAELARPAPAPRPAAPAPRPAAPSPVAARRPVEEGRPAPGSFAALAQEVYGEGVPRAAPMARSGAEEAARDAHREPARGERPDPRAPYVPPRPQATEPARRAPLTRPEAPSSSPVPATPAASRVEPPRADALRAEPPRAPAARPAVPSPEAAHQELARQDALRQDALRQDAARQEAARQDAARQEAARQEAARQEAARQHAARQEAGRREALRQEAVRQEAVRREAAGREAVRPPAPPTSRPVEGRSDAAIPAWMTRAAVAAQASGTEAPTAPAPAPVRAQAPAPAAPPLRQPSPPVAPAFDVDEDAYDYGRSAADTQADAQAYEEYEVEEEAPARGRKRLLMIGGALLIFIGAAAAGYVVMSRPSGSSLSGEPPVIRADQGPNKVVPSQPTQEQAADGQKLIYDRVGGSATTGNEQVVSSEEQPVDVSQAAQPQPRVIQTTPSGSTTASGAPQANSGEPKRVRTLTVRADGTVVEDTSPPATPLPPGAANGAGNPVALNLGSGGSVPTDPAPLSATPSIVDNMANVPAPAPAQAPAQTPAPARVAAAPATQSSGASVPAGAYVVQIASVRSEAEAQATWRATQSKFASLLGNQPFSVKRADLGDRGVYYRAQVGSFSSRDGAVGLCEAMRAQGGSCMVARN